MQTLASTNLSFTITPHAVKPCGGATTRPRSQRAVSAVATQPRPTSRQETLTHSLPLEKYEIFKSLEPWVSDNVLSLLKPVEKCWQPTEFIPDPTKPVSEFKDEVQALRDRTKELPDEYFVVLVGDMVTEEALPTYQSMFNTADAIRDETGSSPSSWATWIRGWTAEENRHGDLLRTFLYLSGRVDMFMVDKTMQYLLGAGMDTGLENNPYLGFVYTSFQERATFISHANTARLASEGGDEVLAKICGVIAADEKRHETANVKIFQKLLEIDPNYAMVSIGKMLRKKITMPAHLMYDGQDPKLFEKFAFLANKIGVYTPDDYASIVEYLVGRWKLEKLEGLKGDGMLEQEFVCTLAPRIRKLQARVDERADKEGFTDLKFSWLFNKKLND